MPSTVICPERLSLSPSPAPPHLALVGNGTKISPQLSRLNFHIIFDPLPCPASICAHFPDPGALFFASSFLLVTIPLVQSLMLFFLVVNVPGFGDLRLCERGRWRQPRKQVGMLRYDRVAMS